MKLQMSKRIKSKETEFQSLGATTARKSSLLQIFIWDNMGLIKDISDFTL